MIILIYDKNVMILFEPLYDILVHKLIAHKWTTIQELHTYISKEQKVSLPNLYKIIGKLIDDQIIIKENWKLFLHNRWILWFLWIADELKNSYLQWGSQVNQLQEWQSMYYEATSIESLDGVRWDWMLSINKIYWKSESTYVYQAHPYYALGMNKTEMAFFKEANKLADVYFLTGNTNFLDKYWANLYAKIGISSLATNNIPFMKDGYCVTVIGDYVFEVIYPKEISDYFKIFFDSIQDIKKFNPDLFHRIFEMKANCKLALRHDSIQARNIKKVFEKVFRK